MSRPIRFRVNGRATTLETGEDRTLLWVLRNDLELTGTKLGCGIGACGSCTVLVDGKAKRSCQTTLKEVAGREVLTIEGLAADGRLHPVQEAFLEHGAYQCGFCTPGMILNAVDLLREHPKPARADIDKGMEDNLCRCGAHQRIIRAIEDAARTMGGKS